MNKIEKIIAERKNNKKRPQKGFELMEIEEQFQNNEINEKEYWQRFNKITHNYLTEDKIGDFWNGLIIN